MVRRTDDGHEKIFHDLIIVNFSNPDMLGHLISQHFREVVQSIEAIEKILQWLIPFALEMGFTVVLTSDHGNADDFSPKHGSHDILTSFISKEEDIGFRPDIRQKARLFDIPWCILDIMGLSEGVESLMPEVPRELKKRDLVGRSLIKYIPS